MVLAVYHFWFHLQQSVAPKRMGFGLINVSHTILIGRAQRGQWSVEVYESSFDRQSSSNDNNITWTSGTITTRDTLVKEIIHERCVFIGCKWRTIIFYCGGMKSRSYAKNELFYFAGNYNSGSC